MSFKYSGGGSDNGGGGNGSGSGDHGGSGDGGGICFLSDAFQTLIILFNDKFYKAGVICVFNMKRVKQFI